MTNLLGPDAPPTIVGFRHSDGRATGHWIPGRQQIEINPTDVTLMLLAADDRPAPGYTFEVSMEQRPWSEGVGVFWGYQEDAAAKAGRQPGRQFARCQALLLSRSRAADGHMQRFIQRIDGQLLHNVDGSVAIGRNNYGQENLTNFSGEQLFQIVVDSGRLKAARFGESVLPNVCQFDTNNHFRPADYRGGFGVISLSANVTVRRPRVMPHADN
jgi:hypothetical protein